MFYLRHMISVKVTHRSIVSTVKQAVNIQTQGNRGLYSTGFTCPLSKWLVFQLLRSEVAQPDCTGFRRRLIQVKDSRLDRDKRMSELEEV
jgi:hypothetical protein